MTYQGDPNGGYGQGQPQQNWAPQGYPGSYPEYPGYPQQGYPQQGYPQQPPPPPPRKNLAVIFSIIALVVIIGAVVTILLVTKNDNEPQAQTPPVTTSEQQSEPEESADPPTRSTSPRTSASAPGTATNPGWRLVRNDKAGLTFEVPPEWSPPTAPTATAEFPGITLSTPISLTAYQCEGKGYSRGIVGAGTATKADPATAATALGNVLGKELYNSGNPTVQVGQPKPVTVGSAKGVQLDVTIKTAAPTCLATSGKIVLVVLDGGSTLKVLMVNGDLAGGPATPASPTEGNLQKIADSVQLIG